MNHRRRMLMKYLKNYIAQYDIPKQVRTDLGAVFTSVEPTLFRSQFQINHINCPVRDRQGNGKIELIIRMINERLRTNNNIFLKRDKSGALEILYALRTGPKADGNSPFEK